MQRLTDFSISEIRMTRTQFQALTPLAKKLLETYGTERPQGFGEPTLILVPTSRIPELERAMQL